jgi:hypothetical protein
VQVEQQRERLLLLPGGRVSNPLIVAFGALAATLAPDQQPAHAPRAVALRCWQMLGGMTHLLADLAALVCDQGDVQDAAGSGSAYSSYWGAMLRHYYGALTPKFVGAAGAGGEGVALGEVVAAAWRLAAPAGQAALPAEGSMSYAQRLAVTYRAYKKMILWDVVLQAGLAPEQLDRRAAAAT